MEKKKKTVSGSGLLIIYVIFVIFFTIFSPVPDFRYGGSSVKQKSCYSNIRLLQGAVEMHNMDSKEQIKDLNKSSIELLVKQGFTKNISYPSKECEYLGKKLDKGGSVYCLHHGDVEGKILGKNEQTSQEKFFSQCLRNFPYALAWPLMLIFILIGSVH